MKLYLVPIFPFCLEAYCFCQQSLTLFISWKFLTYVTLFSLIDGVYKLSAFVT